ncbi:MAG: alcohol dehydrogenase catalytic domain-containing protein [bacterium]
MLAVVKDKPLENHIALQEVPVPGVAEGWVLIKVDLIGICGSDLHTYHWTKDYQQRFKGLLPAIIGHEYTGIVEAVGSGVTDVFAGDRVVSRTPISCGRCQPCLSGQEAICNERRLLGVHYDGAMAEYVTVPARNCHRLPPDYSPNLAALSEPISIAFGVIHKIERPLGKNILIIGPGPIGYFIALLADMAGARKVFLLGLPSDKKRFELFERYIPGVEVESDLQKLKSKLKQGIKDGGVDVAIEASGSPMGPQMAIELTRKQGLVVQAGIFADSPSIDLNAAVRNQITIKGSPALPERLWDRLLALLASTSKKQQEGFEAAISDIFPLNGAVDAFKKAGERKAMKILLSPKQ